MITVKCQYTGIEFEARSKRSKNHPVVSALLSEANKNRSYKRLRMHLRKVWSLDSRRLSNLRNSPALQCAPAVKNM